MNQKQWWEHGQLVTSIDRMREEAAEVKRNEMEAIWERLREFEKRLLTLEGGEPFSDLEED